MGGLQEPELAEMKRLGQGKTADIYEYQADDAMILKLYKQDFPEAAIQQEFLVSRVVHSLGLTTPEPVKFIRYLHRNGIVFRRVTGVPLLDVVGKRPFGVNRYAKLLATLHVQLHRYDVAERKELRDQKQELRDHIQSASALTDQEKEFIVDYLNKLPVQHKLCHGDFHPGNIMVGKENWIIDWMTGVRGNPAGDVARSVILLSTGTMPEETPKYIQYVANIFRKKLMQAYVAHYLRLTGLDYAEIDQWIMPVAAARLTEWITRQEQDQLLNMIKERIRKISWKN